MAETTTETEAELRARHAQELRALRAEQKRVERRDDRDEKHLAKWLRASRYDEFRRLAEERDAELAARREKTAARVTKHREEGVTSSPGEVAASDLFGGDGAAASDAQRWG